MIEHRATAWKLMRDLPHYGDLEVRIWFRKWKDYPYVEQRHEWRSPNGGTQHYQMDEWIKSCGRDFPSNTTPIAAHDDVVQKTIIFLKNELRKTNDPDRRDEIENLLKGLN